jgi:hypothetical protein
VIRDDQRHKAGSYGIVLLAAAAARFANVATRVPVP